MQAISIMRRTWFGYDLNKINFMCLSHYSPEKSLICFVFYYTSISFHLCLMMNLSCVQVSKPGSVKVEKLMNIERYSHVMHISSTVSLLL